MKLRVLVLCLGISSSRALAKIPEAEILDPRLYTVQVNIAELADDFECGDLSDADYDKLSAAKKKEWINTLNGRNLERTRSSNPIYINFATIHAELDKPFTNEKGTVRGVLASSKSFRELEVKLYEYDAIQIGGIELGEDPWFVMFFETMRSDGEWKKYSILVKIYEPLKPVSNNGIHNVPEKAAKSD